MQSCSYRTPHCVKALTDGHELAGERKR
jgi:hypothetical protein